MVPLPVPADKPFLPPHIYGFHAATTAVALADGLQVHVPPWSGPALWPVVRNGSFLYYNFVDGHLARKTEPVGIDVFTLTPKAPPATPLPPLPTTRLYHVLFGPGPMRPTFPNDSSH